MDEELQALFENYRDLKEEVALFQGALERAEENLLRALEVRKQKTLTVNEDGIQFTATYTQRQVLDIDEKQLRRALTARVFDKYTVKKLDRKALEGAMERGEVDPRVVAQHVTPREGKTYLTYRVKETDEAADR